MSGALRGDLPQEEFLLLLQLRIILGAHDQLAGLGGLAAAVGGVIALIPPGFWSSLTSDETSEEHEGKPAGAGEAP